ncbi:hypothetical protein B0H63DRAFT_447622 [Podospora didyma]|uniref:Uncharacterized protein n=1 Tax=Podospora didyma TaxID=330526 RepID=A0AAE0U0R1_9PEZI|nr:hypothetical protein B0H63DRAFT_447622 [Podospora didyma]
MDQHALTQAGGSGDQFSQQGSIDWVQVAQMIVSIPVSILTRLAAADVGPLTAIVGEQMASMFCISTPGHARLTEALSKLKSFSAIGDAIWSGFGIKHIWINLVGTCSGILRSTTFGCIADQFMAFGGGRDWNNVGNARDIANALARCRARFFRSPEVGDVDG